MRFLAALSLCLLPTAASAGVGVADPEEADFGSGKLRLPLTHCRWLAFVEVPEARTNKRTVR